MTLAEIIAKLEVATEGSRELDGDIAEALGLPAIATTGIFHVQRRENREGYGLVDRAEWSRDLPTYFSWKAPAFTTSLDAALTLVPHSWAYIVHGPWEDAEGVDFFLAQTAPRVARAWDHKVDERGTTAPRYRVLRAARHPMSNLIFGYARGSDGTP